MTVRAAQKKKTKAVSKKLPAARKTARKTSGKDSTDQSLALAKPAAPLHGGRTHVGIRKTARPLDLKKPILVTLKSKWAKGKLSLDTPTHRKNIDTIIRDRASQFGITVEQIENSGTTLRITLKAKARDAFQDYLRTMSALIARQVTGARRGKPFGKRFWDHLAQTESLGDN